MQLILVVGKVDMINQICQMLSFCWKLLSAYFAEKWPLSTLLSTVVTAKCACIRNTNICLFPVYTCRSKLVNILTYVQILTYKNGMRYNMKGRWQPGKSASRQPVLSNRRVITNGAYALYIYMYVNMVQVIGVFCTSAAECPVGLLVEQSVACI